MFRSKTFKKYAELYEAIAKIKHGAPIESVLSAYPQAERAALAKMLELVSAVAAMPKAAVPAPIKRRLYLDPAYQKTQHGFAAFFNSFYNFGYGFAAVIAVLVVTGTSFAAARSLPGDTLFGLKATYDNVQLALTRTPENRARLQIEIASQRLQDAQTILASNADPATKSAAISDLNSATSQAIATVQQVAKASPANSDTANLAQNVEQLASAQKALVPASSVDPSQAQALAGIQSTVAAAQASQNTASVPTPKTISVTGKVVAIASGSITVDTNTFTIDPRNIKITNTDGFNLFFGSLAVGETVKVDGEITGDNQNLVDVITLISQPAPTVAPTPAATSTPAAATPQIPVKPNDTFGNVIYE